MPDPLDTPDVAELRRLAEAATPGPWSLTDGDPAMNGQHWTIRRQGVPGIRISGFTYGFNGDAAYIAAANPATVLGLLDRLAHMTEARDNARAEVERLTAMVRRVRELHRESRSSLSALYPNPICECGKDYPCPTLLALAEAAVAVAELRARLHSPAVPDLAPCDRQEGLW